MFDTAVSMYALLAGRLLFGGLLAFMGLNHFRNLESLSAYTESQGIPMPRAAVIGTGLLLAGGGLSIALGAYPMIGTALLVVFFLGVTPTMHGFWEVDDPQQRQQEMNDFLKNLSLLGGSLVLLAISHLQWPFTVMS